MLSLFPGNSQSRGSSESSMDRAMMDGDTAGAVQPTRLQMTLSASLAAQILLSESPRMKCQRHWKTAMNYSWRKDRSSADWWSRKANVTK
ncbi:hypothetical protein AOLI_G00280920 [Acnodon oligacanthus]